MWLCVQKFWGLDAGFAKRTFDAQPGSVREKIRNRPDPHTETRARINVRKPLISHGFAYD